MPQRGRDRDTLEIIRYLRAAQVARVFLGEANGTISPVFPEMVTDWPRKKILGERERIRSYLRGEVKKFCKTNFPKLEPSRLEILYEPLFMTGDLRMPLTGFKEFVGGVIKHNLFRGAPLHSTVIISPCWGLKTEFPEHHLIRDLVAAYNEMKVQDKRLISQKNLSCEELKVTPITLEVADASRRASTMRRMCILSCFNLIEAYINGLGWEFSQTNDISHLSRTEQEMLTEAQGSIVRRLVRVPAIIASSSPVLTEDKFPLKDFISSIKPYRDSIVHASPFAAPERFGGYEKLSKLYDLSTETVEEAVAITEAIIGAIHGMVNGEGELPQWYLARNNDGLFDIDSDIRRS